MSREFSSSGGNGDWRSVLRSIIAHTESNLSVVTSHSSPSRGIGEGSSRFPQQTSLISPVRAQMSYSPSSNRMKLYESQKESDSMKVSPRGDSFLQQLPVRSPRGASISEEPAESFMFDTDKPEHSVNATAREKGAESSLQSPNNKYNDIMRRIEQDEFTIEYLKSESEEIAAKLVTRDTTCEENRTTLLGRIQTLEKDMAGRIESLSKGMRSLEEDGSSVRGTVGSLRDEAMNIRNSLKQRERITDNMNESIRSLEVNMEKSMKVADEWEKKRQEDRAILSENEKIMKRVGNLENKFQAFIDDDSKSDQFSKCIKSMEAQIQQVAQSLASLQLVVRDIVEEMDEDSKNPESEEGELGVQMVRPPSLNWDLTKIPENKKKPLMYVNVNLGPKGRERIGIYEGDDVGEVAAEFVRTYQLDQGMCGKLENLLRSKLEPKCQKLVFEGEPGVGETLTALADYSGAEEGNSQMNWYRLPLGITTDEDLVVLQSDGFYRQKTNCASMTGSKHSCIVDDIDHCLLLEYTPTRSDGVKGQLAISRSPPIRPLS